MKTPLSLSVMHIHINHCFYSINPLTAEFFGNISPLHQTIFLHFLARHQIFFIFWLLALSYLFTVYFSTNSRLNDFSIGSMTYWFYEVLVQWRSAVNLYEVLFIFCRELWKLHLNSTNTMPYKNYWWNSDWEFVCINLQAKRIILIFIVIFFLLILYIYLYTNVVWNIKKNNFLSNITIIWIWLAVVINQGTFCWSSSHHQCVLLLWLDTFSRHPVVIFNKTFLMK